MLSPTFSGYSFKHINSPGLEKAWRNQLSELDFEGRQVTIQSLNTADDLVRVSVAANANNHMTSRVYNLAKIPLKGAVSIALRRAKNQTLRLTDGVALKQVLGRLYTEANIQRIEAAAKRLGLSAVI